MKLSNTCLLAHGLLFFGFGWLIDGAKAIAAISFALSFAIMIIDLIINHNKILFTLKGFVFATVQAALCCLLGLNSFSAVVMIIFNSLLISVLSSKSRKTKINTSIFIGSAVMIMLIITIGSDFLFSFLFHLGAISFNNSIGVYIMMLIPELTILLTSLKSYILPNLFPLEK